MLIRPIVALIYNHSRSYRHSSYSSSDESTEGKSNKITREDGEISNHSAITDLVKKSFSNTQEQIADSARESMQVNQDSAKQYARDLVVEMLGRRTLEKEFGFVLQTIFKTENVLVPTRGLIFWSLQFPSTVDALVQVTKGLRDHYCTHPKGLLWSKESLAIISSWWIQVNYFRSGHFLPFGFPILPPYSIPP